MKFKVGDRVRTLNPHSWTYKSIGVIINCNLICFNLYRVSFNDTDSALFYGEELELHYTTHDILEEIICS